jgi:hypothetical protein
MTIAVRVDLGIGGAKPTREAYSDWHATRALIGRGAVATPLGTEGPSFNETELFFDVPPVPEMTMEEFRELPAGSGGRIMQDGKPIFLVLPDPDGTLKPFMTRRLTPEHGSYRFDEYDDALVDQGARDALYSALSDFGIRPDATKSGALASSVQDHLLGDGSRTFAAVFSAMSGYRMRHHVGRNMQGHAVDRWICVCEGTRAQDMHYVDATGHDGWLGFKASIGNAPLVEELAPVQSVDVVNDPNAKLALAWIDNMPALFGSDWIRTLRERTFGEVAPADEPVPKI